MYSYYKNKQSAAVTVVLLLLLLLLLVLLVVVLLQLGLSCYSYLAVELAVRQHYHCSNAALAENISVSSVLRHMTFQSGRQSAYYFIVGF